MHFNISVSAYDGSTRSHATALFSLAEDVIQGVFSFLFLSIFYQNPYYKGAPRTYNFFNTVNVVSFFRFPDFSVQVTAHSHVLRFSRTAAEMSPLSERHFKHANNFISDKHKEHAYTYLPIFLPFSYSLFNVNRHVRNLNCSLLFPNSESHHSKITPLIRCNDEKDKVCVESFFFTGSYCRQNHRVRARSHTTATSFESKATLLLLTQYATESVHKFKVKRF